MHERDAEAHLRPVWNEIRAKERYDRCCVRSLDRTIPFDIYVRISLWLAASEKDSSEISALLHFIILLSQKTVHKRLKDGHPNLHLQEI